RRVAGPEPGRARRPDALRAPVVRGALARRSSGGAVGAAAARRRRARAPDRARPGPVVEQRRPARRGPPRTRGRCLMSLREFLQSQGVPEPDIETAEKQGPEAVQLLAMDRLLVPGVRRYTQREVVEC